MCGTAQQVEEMRTAERSLVCGTEASDAGESYVSGVGAKAGSMGLEE